MMSLLSHLNTFPQNKSVDCLRLSVYDRCNILASL